MSLFSFNFKLKNDENKENVQSFKPLTPFSMTSESFVIQTPKQPIFGSNKDNDSAKSQNCFGVMSGNNRMTESLPVEHNIEKITEDSNVLKRRVVEELEKIETFKAMTDMEIKRQSNEIQSLMTINEDSEKKLSSLRKENSELKVKMNVEIGERNQMLSKMNTTREMVNKLKDYVEYIETRLEALDEVKHAFDLINDHRCRQLSDLSERFTKLDLKHKTIVSDLQTDITQKNTELNGLNQTFERKCYDFEDFKTKAEQQLESFVAENNDYKQTNESIEVQKNELIQKLSDFEERQQSLLTSAQNKEEETLKMKYDFENKVKELEEKIESFSQNEKNLKEIIDELKANVESNEQNICDFETEIEKKDQSIADLENEIKDKDKEMTDLLSQITDLVQSKDELNLSYQTERQNLETTLQSEKTSIINDFEKTIEEKESLIKTLNEENNKLIKLKEENVLQIDELESKANQSMVEKETIEQKLTDDLKELKTEFDNKMNEFSSKIEEMENRIKELNELKDQNETTICEMRTETEAMKTEREELKQKLEKDETTLKNQMSNMSKILESCKSDYNKRIEDKEERIKEYRKEHERMRLSVDQLTKKCERLETEKQSIGRNLHELTMNSMRPTERSPNRVLTPKFMSPIESTRLSSQRSSLVKPLDFSSDILSEKDLHLSAKQEFEEKRSSQNSQKVVPVFKQKVLKPRTKSESKQMSSKGKEVRNVFTLDESTTNESVYELIDEKLKKNKRRVQLKETDGKHRIESPVKVNMSFVDNKQMAKSDDTDEYDIDKVDRPLKKKKPNVSNPRTYDKKDLRTKNVMKGRPTPTKDDDLSWLFS